MPTAWVEKGLIKGTMVPTSTLVSERAALLDFCLKPVTSVTFTCPGTFQAAYSALELTARASLSE